MADATMQQLASEFNFSETTFVLPTSDPSCTCRVRIFTPRQELPFAGHATVGTAPDDPPTRWCRSNRN